jgi:hypothetical protein
MKTASRVLCALLVLCMAASGAGPVLVITDGGYQIMSVGSDGKAVLTAVGSVVDMRGTPGPGPTPPDVTTDPIAVQVKGWSDAVGDPTTRQALAEVYKRVGESSAGQPREKVLAALRQATDGVLGATGGTVKWAPWRDNVSKLIDAEEAKGPIDWVKFCASVSKGLDTGTALDPVLLQLIINLIMQIIQMFFGGGGTGV